LEAVKKVLENTIFSLTSYPARINTVYITIESLLDQTVKPEKIILWLSDEEFPNRENGLPDALLFLKEKGLTIDWYNNIRSYKKLIPTLKKYPGKIIITFDDDSIYHKETAEALYNCHKEYPNDIIAHRMSRLFYIEDELYFLSRELYCEKMSMNYYVSLKAPSFFNKFTGVCGVLYPPGCLHPDVLDEEKFMSLAPTIDDIWFWVHAVRVKTYIRIPEIHFPTVPSIPGSQETGLYRINDWNDLNTQSLSTVFKVYPDVNKILQSENEKNSQIVNELLSDTDNPQVSIVCFTHNHEATIHKCLDAILTQKKTFSFELFIFANASTDNTLSIVEEYKRKFPNIIKLIVQYNNTETANLISIISKSLCMIKGSFIAFCEGNNIWNDPDRLENQMTFLDRFLDCSVTTTAFQENKNGKLVENLISCGDLKGFEYNSIEERGYSHCHFSTLMCRKSTLMSIHKKYRRVKNWDNIFLAHLLLDYGYGWYSSENTCTSNILPLENDASQNEKTIRNYISFREFYRITKDITIFKFYHKYFYAVLDRRLYKNKAEKLLFRLVFYNDNNRTRRILLKKFIGKIFK
jgi:glycosyltransferase involved in cell wall biosynthesis